MRADQIFVGAIALAIGGMALSASLGWWHRPFRVRTIMAIQERWGEAAARTVLGCIAAGMLGSGAAILLDARPGFAMPQPPQNDADSLDTATPNAPQPALD